MDKSENIVERKCFELLEQAVMKEATDIHFVPTDIDYAIHLNKGFKLTKSARSLPS